jgi:hypothetical protein
MDLADALMELTKTELPEVEVTTEEGHVIRPFRFCEIDPKVTESDGVTHL